MTNVPTFETTRLWLTGLTVEDASAYQEHFVDYDVIRHLSSHVPWPFPETGVDVFFKTQLLPLQGIRRWSWGIRLKSNPIVLMGCIEIWRDGDPENRGFWLGKNFWGQGYMTEALYPINDYAFNVLGFETLIFANARGNHRSHRIKIKTGAKLIGIKPATFVDPRYTEQEIWELSKADWQKFKESIRP